MSDKIVHSSEINVLAHLIDGSEIINVVFDPNGLMVTDDDAGLIRVNSLETLLPLVANKMDKRICVANLGLSALAVPGIDYIIEFDRSLKNYSGMKQVCWQYINNPDGSMRWLYPSSIRRPWFLAFYNFNYWKANLYKLVSKTAFFFRLTRLFSNGRVAIFSSGKPLFIEFLLHPGNEERPNYAIFTGTNGPNRKIVLADAGAGKLTHYFKIALNERSALNLQNEFIALKKLEKAKSEAFVVPKVEAVNSNAICLSNIKPASSGEQPGFCSLHTEFLAALYGIGTTSKPFNDLSMAGETAARIQRVAKHGKLSTIPNAAALCDKLQLLQTQIKALNPVVTAGQNHGDFTRWNCYQSKQRLHVYDWEMSKPDMPLLYDFFHFMVQGSVFAKNATAKDIKVQLEAALNTQHVKDLLHRYGVDAALYFKYYLLYNISYYLEIYLEQYQLHKEVGWLFNTWNELLLAETAGMEGMSYRKQFIERLFEQMQQDDYVVLKNAGKPMDSLSEESDIDILIKPAIKQKLMAFAASFPGVQRMRCNHKSFMTTMELFFTDNSFIGIDLLRGFHRKSYSYISANLLLENSIQQQGISILPPAYDYLYIYLFYQLNYSGIPDKYSQHFTTLNSWQENQVLQVLNANTGMHFGSIAESFSFSSVNRERVYAFLRKKGENNLLYRAGRWLQYQRNTIADFIHSRGFMLTFSGVDGAGKSTILNEVKEMLQKKYRKKVIVIRHRPSMLPILSAWKYGKEEAERKCVESLPRKGNNRSLISSMGRFAYYYTDYIVGQVIVYFKYTLRGYIVLYDRYYFDFIVDGRRSNITINKSFIRNLYRFVYKPQLNIFLYAPPEVILRRKKELSADDITQLTDAYTHLFHRLGNPRQYMCIENVDKGKTMHTIEQAFIQLN
jgi:thymidylate kinase